jgi:hypothetical protein
LRTILPSSSSSATELPLVKSRLCAVEDKVTAIHSDLPGIRATIEDIAPEVILTTEKISSQIHHGNQTVRDDISRTEGVLVAQMAMVLNQLTAMQAQSTASQHHTTQILQAIQKSISHPTWADVGGQQVSVFSSWRLSRHHPWIMPLTKISTYRYYRQQLSSN